MLDAIAPSNQIQNKQKIHRNTVPLGHSRGQHQTDWWSDAGMTGMICKLVKATLKICERRIQQ